MIQQTGIDGVTVARGAIGNPWIFRRRVRWRPVCRYRRHRRLHQQAAVMREHFSSVRADLLDRAGTAADEEVLHQVFAESSRSRGGASGDCARMRTA